MFHPCLTKPCGDVIRNFSNISKQFQIKMNPDHSIDPHASHLQRNAHGGVVGRVKEGNEARDKGGTASEALHADRGRGRGKGLDK